MSALKQFVFIFLSFSCWWAIGAEPLEILQSEYSFIHSTAQTIEKDYPTTKYYYVGLGRSPSPFIAYLQLIGIDSAAYLPASKLKWANNLDRLSDFEKRQLREHLLRFLPPKAELDGRTLLLIDHTQSALGLQRMRHYIRGLLGSDYPVESLALVFSEHNHEYLDEMVDHKILYNDEKQIENFASQKYDDYAAFGEAIIFQFDKLKNVSPNLNYSVLLYAIYDAIHLYSSCESQLISGGRINEIMAQTLAK